MKHEINIYGEIVPFKWLKDGSEYDRADLNAEIDSLDLQQGDELVYNIHTLGGCTTTAFAMYNKLKRIKNEKKITLTSRADGYCASSGVILLLAADKRIGSKYLMPFVHNAWTWVMGDKNEVKKVFEDLVKVDDAIAELYSEETSISKDQAINIMSESRDLTLQECISFGFYTELENVKTVYADDVFNSIILRRKNFTNNMATKNKDAERKSIMKRIENFLLGSSTQNKILYTANNSELDFYELAENDTPKAKSGDTLGDKAKYDGKPAGDSNNGEYIMPNGEIYKFSGEELIEIIPKEEENDNEFENLKTENSKLKEEIEKNKKTILNLNKRVSESETIINNFKQLESDFEEDNDDKNKRNPKNKIQNPPKRNLFKNLR